MRQRRHLFFLLFMAFAAFQGGNCRNLGGLTLSSVTPNAVVAGTNGVLTITLTGYDFNASSIVNTTSPDTMTYKYVSPTSITVSLGTAATALTTGSYTFTVTNPASGDIPVITSNAVAFTVGNPVAAAAGGAAPLLPTALEQCEINAFLTQINTVRSTLPGNAGPPVVAAGLPALTIAPPTALNTIMAQAAQQQAWYMAQTNTNAVVVNYAGTTYTAWGIASGMKGYAAVAPAQMQAAFGMWTVSAGVVGGTTSPCSAASMLDGQNFASSLPNGTAAFMNNYSFLFGGGNSQLPTAANPAGGTTGPEAAWKNVGIGFSINPAGTIGYWSIIMAP